MPRTSAAQLEAAIRSCWCLWTSDPVDQPTWSSSNPAWGQCASTALIVQDLLGGQVLIADVRHEDGSRQGVHYFNRLPDGGELDLTREQFVNGEIVSAPRLAERPADPTTGRLAGQYRLLAAAVARRLKTPRGGPESPRPVSVKGVCLDPGGRVLLCRNRRAEWELPGGRPEIGERLDRCVEREVREETGLAVEARNVIDAYAFEVQEGAWVDVLVYGCSTTSPSPPSISPEHETVAWRDAQRIAADQLPAGYARAIEQWHARLRPREPAQAPAGPARPPWR
ncbi:MAG: YunG family protein [Solirubrobacteraceae bacterium]